MRVTFLFYNLCVLYVLLSLSKKNRKKTSMKNEFSDEANVRAVLKSRGDSEMVLGPPSLVHKYFQVNGYTHTIIKIVLR